MIALDTNAVSALFDGDEALAEALASTARVSLPVVVIGEYRYGLQRSRHRRQLADLLEVLIARSDVLIVDAGTTAHYARVREGLRSRGRPLPENDVWIAALCAQHELPLLTRDEHFRQVPDLTVRGW